MYSQFTYSTGLKIKSPRNKEILAVIVTSENMNVIPANIFTADKNCCWLDGGGKLIPDLEFREGSQILRHQVLSYLNAY